MKLLGPSRHSRLNEVVGFVLLIGGICLALSLASYSPLDSSFDTATGTARSRNLLGTVGAHISDLLLQVLGISSYLIPFFIWLWGWKWIRSGEIGSPKTKLMGAAIFTLTISASCGLISSWHPLRGDLSASGVIGLLLADWLVAWMNPLGATAALLICGILSIYIISSFEVAMLARWFHGPMVRWAAFRERWKARSEERRQRALEKAQEKAALRAARRNSRNSDEVGSVRSSRRRGTEIATPEIPIAPVADSGYQAIASQAVGPLEEVEQPLAEDDIPIHTLENLPVERNEENNAEAPPFDVEPAATPSKPARKPRNAVYKHPSTTLLNEVPMRSTFDSQELKETAGRIKGKFEEFNVRGSVTQINPGPVVTTFEFKPEAGVKYSRITTLSEDLCLGLQAESILIERIPGKPTVGIEVPNTRREVISLREILESEEFNESPSKMTIALGKDINGRIKVTALETMPHLLIAGSTGSGKSVMLNALIMSILYKSTPDDVRMIMVDPKRVELGIYEGIPHLLTPVITESKKATNALRNAVLEMERRLKLLASLGVRNIDQFNKKVRLMKSTPMNLFDESPQQEDELKPLPFILILIDELADLMMLERANVEECITRLAQMARAVGMHLVLATQRPSVDVITGIIKANFPSRISFRVATRVDSRTVLDSMGAEHLLGKGDMLFLPPGSSRLTRVHGAFVTEAETNDVVEFWKSQATPDYDQTYLLTPPNEDEDGDAEVFDGEQDPMYQDAVRIVLEMGKASTSTLQRRLRLGYGRAARILDMMQHEGIIGPPDGSKPREVLKRPDWLHEVESQLR